MPFEVLLGAWIATGLTLFIFSFLYEDNPLFKLAEHLYVGVSLGFRDTPTEPSQGVAVLVESEGGGKAALLVETIQGQRQVVIKSLETNYQPVEGVAAATILGDGRVALILDVDVLVTDMRRKSFRPDFKRAS